MPHPISHFRNPSDGLWANWLSRVIICFASVFLTTLEWVELTLVCSVLRMYNPPTFGGFFDAFLGGSKRLCPSQTRFFKKHKKQYRVRSFILVVNFAMKSGLEWRYSRNIVSVKLKWRCSRQMTFFTHFWGNFEGFFLKKIFFFWLTKKNVILWIFVLLCFFWKKYVFCIFSHFCSFLMICAFFVVFFNFSCKNPFTIMIIFRVGKIILLLFYFYFRFMLF